VRADSGERGNAAIEAAVIIPGVLLLVCLLIVVGRVQGAGGSVEAAARDAARSASIARTAGDAQAAAESAARRSLADQGVTCTSSSVHVDTAGFAAPLGEPAAVSVDVACMVSLADLPIPGMSSRLERAHFTSPLDSWRAR
jgi:Flp pilus assembly protein TadG